MYITLKNPSGDVTKEMVGLEQQKEKKILKFNLLELF